MLKRKIEKAKKKCLLINEVNVFGINHPINIINIIKCQFFETSRICLNKFKILDISQNFLKGICLASDKGLDPIDEICQAEWQNLEQSQEM